MKPFTEIAEEVIDSYLEKNITFKEMSESEIVGHRWVQLPTWPKKYSLSFNGLSELIATALASAHEEGLETGAKVAEVTCICKLSPNSSECLGCGIAQAIRSLKEKSA